MKYRINGLSENTGGEALVLLGFMLGFGLYSALIGQDFNWDLKQYHFYNGYAFLHHRFDRDIGPAMVQTYINPFFDVINYLLIALQKPMLTEFLLGSVSGISAFILYKIAKLLFANSAIHERRIFILFSVLVGMTGTNTISLLNTTTNDNKMALLVILSLYFSVKGIIATQNRSLVYIYLSAFLVGLVTGFKMPAVCYAMGLFATVFAFKNDFHRPYFVLISFVFFMACGFLVANGYWMFFLYSHFENPIFPYYNNIFHSPYAPFFSFNMPAGHGKLYFHHYFFLPFYLAFKNNLVSEYMRDARLAVIFAIGFAILFKYIFLKNTDRPNPVVNKKIQHAWQAIFIFFFVSYLVWLSLFMVYRYILPLELIMGLIIVSLLRSLFTSEVIQRIFLAILVSILITTTSYTDRNNQIPYQKEFFALTAPDIPANSIILLTSVPLSFVIPFFPDKVRFIGMPFVGLGIDTEKEKQHAHRKMLMHVYKLIREATTPVFTLSFQHSDRFDQKTIILLNRLGLKQDTSHCKFFKTNINDQLKLCPLRKI